jgi:hypothetical protein
VNRVVVQRLLGLLVERMATAAPPRNADGGVGPAGRRPRRVQCTSACLEDLQTDAFAQFGVAPRKPRLRVQVRQPALVWIQIGDVLADRGHRQVGGKGFNGPSHFSFEVDGDRGSRMTIRA